MSAVDLLSLFVTFQEPTEARPPPKTKTEQVPSAVDPQEEPQKPPASPYSPTAALLRLLQTAFNRQTPSFQQHSSPRISSRWEEREPSRSLPLPTTRLPPQQLYQALDTINKYRGRDDSIYNDYSDGFYSNKPYRHRDDRLLQALFDMITEERQ